MLMLYTCATLLAITDLSINPNWRANVLTFIVLFSVIICCHIAFGV